VCIIYKEVAVEASVNGPIAHGDRDIAFVEKGDPFTLGAGIDLASWSDVV